MPTPSSTTLTLRVPGSSANLGPGFDTLGIAVAVYVTVEAQLDRSRGKEAPPALILSYTGDGEEKVSTVPKDNMVTQVALDVLSRQGLPIPGQVQVKVHNTIPLGRGLGSSGAAIVAGVLLGQWLGGLESWGKERLLQECLVHEPHPDNVAPSLYGGCMVTAIPSPTPTNPTPLPLPVCIPVSRRISAVALIPAWSLSTEKARASLPDKYGKADVVSNLQRISLLVASLGQDPPAPQALALATEDLLHQPYRAPLVPGLQEALVRLRYPHVPGVYTSFLSGAGPTILVLIDTAEKDAAHAGIANISKDIWGEENMGSVMQVGLDLEGVNRILG